MAQARLRILDGQDDLDWVVRCHGEIYGRERGWDASFTQFVAGIAATFAASADPRRERGWIAELDGRRSGSVLCTRADDETALLRLLLVDPAARGHGLGGALVDRCVSFARDAGYATIELGTTADLIAARRLYDAAGFAEVGEERRARFGHDVVEQVLRLDLG